MRSSSVASSPAPQQACHRRGAGVVPNLQGAGRMPLSRERFVRRRPVDSSSIAEIGYAPDRRELEVLFRNGGLYRYFDVPAPVHRALLEAESIGRYMNRHVRTRYRYRRLREAPARRSPATRVRSPRRRSD